MPASCRSVSRGSVYFLLEDGKYPVLLSDGGAGMLQTNDERAMLSAEIMRGLGSEGIELTNL